MGVEVSLQMEVKSSSIHEILQSAGPLRVSKHWEKYGEG